jgi:UDP-N-acetyl-D-mannosaminuronic acid dehydrogenase
VAPQKDPWLLIHGLSRFTPRVIVAARNVNDRMPLHVARLVEDALDECGLIVHGSRIAVLGYAYLENTDDGRNSPTQALCEHLTDWGATVHVHDPLIPAYANDMWKTIEGADALVIMVAHDAFQPLDLARIKKSLTHPILIDGRRVVESAAAREAGFVFRSVGRVGTMGQEPEPLSERW